MTDMPDFDSMTPEEMMKWMESLAKRQGATEGLTTSADMNVAEVSADDERLAGQGDYVPYGWTAEKWKEHLAKEEAEKAAKQPATPAQPPKATAAPTPKAEPAPEPVAPAASASGTPDFESMSPEELMKWMESLAVRQGATEGLTTSADMQVAEVAADDERLAGQGDYIPFGWTEEKWKEKLAKEEAEKAAKKSAAPAQPVQQAKPTQPEPVAAEEDEELAEALAGDVLAAPSLDDLFAGNNLIADDEDEEEEEVIAAELPSFDDLFGGATDNSIPELDLSALEGLGAESAGVDNPMDWLAGLASADEGIPDLDMDALSSLAALGGSEPEAEAETSPMDWLAGLAEDGEIEGEQDTEEGSLEWLETLARREGADSEELFTKANLDIPMPDNILDDGPGYEDFSFEQGSGMIVDSEEEELVPSFDVDSMDMTDPENWLEQLAASQSGMAQVDFDDEDDLDEPETAIPTFNEVSGDIREKINKGEVSPDEILLMFQTAFDEAGKRTDVADYIDSEDEEEEDIVEAPVEAEIPDWLREQMNVVPEPEAPVAAPKKGDTAEMMLKNLGLEAEADDVDELPDWLKGGAGEDTGDIAVDIFDNIQGQPEPQTPINKTTEEVVIADTEDTWVQAFQQEASGELEEWYEERVAELEGSKPPVPSITEPVVASIVAPIAASAESLQSADLPVESSLEHGEAMLVPAWMGGEAVATGRATVMPTISEAAVDDMDWLGGDTEAADIDMPDWLKEQVDDSVAPAEDLPSWLAGDNIDIESVEEIPDWLRETMGEEEALPDVDFAVEPEPTLIPEPVIEPKKPEPTITVPAVVQKSPAPVPRAVAVDVSATLQSAQQRVSIGDIDGALLEYEAVVRANQALDQVEKAIDKLATSDTHKRNPSVFRVLGDVRMRQGKLQEALDTYRRALNML